MVADLYQSAIANLVRPAIRQLQPYSSARGLTPVASGPTQIYLDANEWSGDAPNTALQRYPDPQPPILREAYAQFIGVSPAQLLIGRGADEAIDVLIRTFCDAVRDAIIVTPPTYGFYGVSAAIQGTRIIEVPLLGDNFDMDETGILSAIEYDKTKFTAQQGQVKLVFVCSPNNPTGNLFAQERLLTLASELEGKAILVVDEAYIELTGAASLAPYTADHPNLVVLRTMSKALAHAGARIGAAVAAPELIAWLQKVRAPYPLSMLQVDAAIQAFKLCDPAELNARRTLVASERRRLGEHFSSSRVVQTVWPSVANFLLVRMHHHKQFLECLRSKGIVIRDRSSDFALDGCVRITVGSRSDNDALLAAFDQWEKQL